MRSTIHRREPAHDAEAEHQREHLGAARRGVAEVAAVRDHVHLGHRHGDAARNTRNAQQGLERVGRESERPVRVPRRVPRRGRGGRDGGRLSLQREREQRHRDQAEHASPDISRAPAEVVDEILHRRRPDGAGEVVAAHHDRNRDSAPAREPKRNVGDQRYERRRGAEQPDQQPLGRGELHQVLRHPRGDEAEGKADRADEHRHPHAEPVGELSHEDAADAEPDHGQRIGKRRGGPRDPEFRLQRRQRNGHRVHARAADRHQGERDPEADPGVGGFGVGLGEGHGLWPGAGRVARASKVAMIASKASADRARDQCIPIRPPMIPMVTPEKARMPRLERM